MELSLTKQQVKLYLSLSRNFAQCIRIFDFKSKRNSEFYENNTFNKQLFSYLVLSNKNFEQMFAHYPLNSHGGPLVQKQRIKFERVDYRTSSKMKHFIRWNPTQNR